MQDVFKTFWRLFVMVTYIIALYAVYYGIFIGIYCLWNYLFSPRHQNKSFSSFFRFYWSVITQKGFYYSKGDNSSKKKYSAGDEWHRDSYNEYSGTNQQARRQDVDPFVILGINEHTDYNTARLAYHKLVRAHHPDVTGGSDDDIKRINAAWHQVCQIKGWGKTYAQA